MKSPGFGKITAPAALVALIIAGAAAFGAVQAPVSQPENGAAAGQRGQAGGAAGQRGQRGGRGAQPAAPSAPTPRLPDGKVRLGPLPGEKGIWVGGGAFSNQPFLPWAKMVYDYRQANELEPHTRCKPSGGPRQFLTPYGVEFVDIPEQKRILIMDIGGPHTYRVIHMDAEHPKDLFPSYYGHSTGRWEGDTLVVDTIGFNEGFWFDRRGSPHTEKLHLIERFTRKDFNTMTYELTVDDPGAYTAPWTGGFDLRWRGGEEMFEYVCQDNNFAPTLLIGSEKSIDRSSDIVP